MDDAEMINNFARNVALKMAQEATMPNGDFNMPLVMVGTGLALDMVFEAASHISGVNTNDCWKLLNQVFQNKIKDNE